jgi:hypothetical protein
VHLVDSLVLAYLLGLLVLDLRVDRKDYFPDEEFLDVVLVELGCRKGYFPDEELLIEDFGLEQVELPGFQQYFQLGFQLVQVFWVQQTF